MVQIVQSNSDVIRGGKYGRTITYEVVAVNDLIAEQRVKARATAGSPLSAGAIEITESEILTDPSEPLQEFKFKVFVPNETIVQRLGAERAKDGLRELGFIE